MPDPELRLTFNSVASLYDEVRPGYPDELIEDVITLSGISSDGKILEVGCGTGQATRPFAERGYGMLCLDIGADLIEVAKKQLHQFGNVAFSVCSFEDWSSDCSFDLIISSTAFHWIDPAVRYSKAAEFLSETGALAVFSNTHIWKNEGFFADVQDVYRRHVPEWCQPSKDAKPASPTSIAEPGLDRFSEPTQRVYPWEAYYTAKEYVRLLNTYSDHIALPDQKRKALFNDIEKFIDVRHSGRILKHYEAVLNVRKRKD